MTVKITCPKCQYSKELAEDRIPPGVRWARCPRCKERFEVTRDLERLATRESGRMPPPWERRSEMGLTEAIFQTARQVTFSPRAFFKNTAVEGGLTEALAFGVLFGSIGLMLELFWGELTGEGSLASIQIDFLGDYGTSVVFLIATILCPLGATVVICVTSLIVHLFLSVVGAAKSGFEATFRAVSYSQATQFWALIPYVGGLIAMLWLFVVQLIGIREIHGVSYIRVLLAFFIPVALVVTVLAAAGLSWFLMD